MYKNFFYYKILLGVFLLFSFKVFAHIEHHKNLESLKFDIYRNNNFIGTHIFEFTKKNNLLSVKSIIDFQIKKFGVVLYKYHAEGIEVYRDNKLISFNSKTKQNKKNKFCNIKFTDNKLFIDGSSYKGIASTDFPIGTWWNHEIINAKAQISAISGRIIYQKVNFLGKEKIELNGVLFNTLHFNFSSTDEKLSKDKKLNTDVWYDAKTLMWVKATFNKTGFWEYKLKNF